MNIPKFIAEQIQAARLRRSVRGMRKSRSLSADLRNLIDKCHEVSPETAELLDQVLFPKLHPHTHL